MRLAKAEIVTDIYKVYSQGKVEQAIKDIHTLSVLDQPSPIDDNISYMLSEGYNPHTIVKMGIDPVYLVQYLEQLEKEYVNDIESTIIFAKGADAHSLTLPGVSDGRNGNEAVPPRQLNHLAASELTRAPGNVRTGNSDKGRMVSEITNHPVCTPPADRLFRLFTY